MPKTLLDVGNCSLDQRAIRRAIEDHFDARVTSVRRADEALEAMRRKRYDLVLVNRSFGGSKTAGLDLLAQIKSDAQLSATPVMLLSNHADAQQAAVAAGAEPGFGKDDLDGDTAREKLGRFLGGE